MNAHIVGSCLLATCLFLSHVAAQQQSTTQISVGELKLVKILGFINGKTGDQYRVISYNVVQMTTESTIRSVIKVSRIKSGEKNRLPNDHENIQTINFHPFLVDFDLHCSSEHCYMVAVTSRSKLNIELFSWQRTQFDLLAKRDSFSRPHAVKLFKIQSGFYIALAQDQLHLSPYKFSQEYEDQTRFIGCAILKFFQRYEREIKYHQFIRLPFNPRHVGYFTSINSNNVSTNAIVRPTENHYLVFSVESNWTEPGSSQVHTYIWSPLNDHFWPYRLPRGAEFKPKPETTGHIVKFPSEPPRANLTHLPDYVGLVESCFHQLQRLLADRELQARRLIESSRSIWRSPNVYDGNQDLTNISSQVIVHGNVIVKGSLIESPQISLIGRPSPESVTIERVFNLVNSHSPAVVENKLKLAFYKLNHIREKLSHAPIANLPRSITNFNSQLRFFGAIQADEVIFSGVANSNVRLNGIPFEQLEHELVSLIGAQDIRAKVMFTGKVVADVLEIHGVVNGYFQIKDAIDITSKRVQIIDITGNNYILPGPNVATLDFISVSAPEVILSHNATINTILLNDFITRDDRTQTIFGRKSFKRLSMARLDLAHQGVQLNGLNLSRIATDSIRLRDPSGRPYRLINGNHMTFSRRIRVNKLTVNNIINQHINLSSLIHDSVKTVDIGQQQISGHKNFLNGLKIGRLTTEGAINGIQINQVFNLNPVPPLSNLGQHFASHAGAPIVGEFIFRAPATIHGNVNAALVNGVDIALRAIRRQPSIGNNTNFSVPQVVRGRKIFVRPLRVLNKVKLVDPQHKNKFADHNLPTPYPLINGFDLRMINAGLTRQMQRPPVIYVDNLEIDGNLNLPTSHNLTGPSRITIGNYSLCPLDVIRSKLVLAGTEEQFIDLPIKLNSLRARNVQLEPGALNGLSFPNDFVLRSAPDRQQSVEPIFGYKTFDHLSVSPSIMLAHNHTGQPSYNSPHSGPTIGGPRGILLDIGSSINTISYSEMQNFILHERRRNSTGEKVFGTLNVYGNIRAKRINGYYWPEDILLKSVGSLSGHLASPYVHKRIYSPLVFLNSSDLEILNQLVLRGPIQLHGRMNGVNLTEFARQSATYGDKDLMSISRPIKNKIFLGGMTVNGEIRSQGLVDGVNFDEMRNRVVAIGPPGKRVHVLSPKIFLSDAKISSPIKMMYLNDLPIDHYLRRIQFQPDGITIKVFGKKTITGALRAKNLIVRGLINGIDFADFKARAISLAPTQDEIQFNRTLTIEGDVFMDNLLIDEKNGTIDGVKLTNLLPLGNFHKNELVISDPSITRHNNNGVSVSGAIQDCQITCSLHPPQARPIYQPPQQVVSYPPRPIINSGRNVTIMRTPPPYVIPIAQTRSFSPHPQPIQSLALRQPFSIKYEQKAPVRRLFTPRRGSIVLEQIEGIRRQIVSLNLVGFNSFRGIVVGFIEATVNDIGNFQLPEQDTPHSDHIVNPKSFLQLDQIDFPFRPTTYHLSVGVATNRDSQNITSVFSSIGESQLHQLSILPIESPNSAKFLKVVDTLFLLISQDYTIHAGKGDARCPAGGIPQMSSLANFNVPKQIGTNQVEGGIQVYLFHALQSSSSLTSAYFDLYQTIDLPAIDSFEDFNYRGSTYVLAVSRPTGRVYLLLLRGYSGFQVVSYIDAPMVEYIRVIYTADMKPALIIYQTNGLHRLVEAVII